MSWLLQKYLTGEIKYAVDSLVKIKVSSCETAYGEHVKIIDDYIENEISAIENYLSTICREKYNSYDKLNQLFITLLIGKGDLM